MANEEVVILDKDSNQLRSLTGDDLLALLGITTVALPDLDPAPSLDGTEIAGISKDGSGVRTTVQGIAGNPVTAVRTFAKDRISGYTNFNRIAPGYSNTTDATPISLESFYLNRSGAAAGMTNGAFFYSLPTLTITTGTDTTGYACASHFEQPILFDPTKEYDQTWDVSHVALPTTGQASTTQVGFLVGYPALATQGMYFYLDQASNNWFYAVKNAGGTTSDDTTVAGTLGVSRQALRVHYDPVALSTKFYIDGTLRATVANATRVVATSQSMGMGVSIRKSAGTTANYFNAFHHSFNIQRSVLANF